MISLPKEGDLAIGTVIAVFPTYAILIYDEGWTGLLHISELSNNFIRRFTNFVTVGSIFLTKVIAIENYSANVRVSLKATTPQDKRRAFRHQPVPRVQIDFTPLRNNLPHWIEEAK